MKRLVRTALLPLLVIACASQPKKIDGRYAIVLHPELAARDSVRGTPLLHHAVQQSLQTRLVIAPSLAEADAVILLSPGRTPNQLEYEIRRNETVTGASAAMKPVRPGADRTIGQQLEDQRRTEHVRTTPMIEIPRRDIDRSFHEDYASVQRAAIFDAGNRIAAAIIDELSQH
jgi:hypothetical protein